MSDKKYKALHVTIEIALPFISDLSTTLAWSKIIESQIMQTSNPPPKIVSINAVEDGSNDQMPPGKKVEV